MAGIPVSGQRSARSGQTLTAVNRRCWTMAPQYRLFQVGATNGSHSRERAAVSYHSNESSPSPSRQKDRGKRSPWAYPTIAARSAGVLRKPLSYAPERVVDKTSEVYLVQETSRIPVATRSVADDCGLNEDFRSLASSDLAQSSSLYLKETFTFAR